MKRDFLALLDYLYGKTKDRRYMPTVEELENQPVGYIQRAYSHNAEHFTDQDLLKLCVSKETGTDIHEWLFGTLGMTSVTTLEMANKAASIGNVEALDWIIGKNPEAFPSEDSIVSGMNSLSLNFKRKTELAMWLFDKRPELIPAWERLKGLGYYGVSSVMLQKVKDYQEGRVWELQVGQMDQQMPDEITKID
ncbi:hypothetical protein PSACC_03533 [Paramicrosporidium saccamoebae]|uniref:Uncharacterized protein n=1 Tax=Paramicrosporidium saccamoebae TaxID=1246581 RepID=A0A2H9TG05_9FUNG|nr:hypothetical protein PSACC_03533 [Paramicrosporidium saccamoebae]